MSDETLILQFGQTPPAFCIGVPKGKDAVTILALQPHPDVRGPADFVPDEAIVGDKVVLQFATVESLDVLIGAAQHLRKRMARREQHPWRVYTMVPGGLDVSAAAGNGRLDLNLLAAHLAIVATPPERPEATPGRGDLRLKTDQELEAEIAHWENEIKSASGRGASLGLAGEFLKEARNETYRRGLERAQREAGVFGGLNPVNYRKSEAQWHFGSES